MGHHFLEICASHGTDRGDPLQNTEGHFEQGRRRKIEACKLE